MNKQAYEATVKMLLDKRGSRGEAALKVINPLLNKSLDRLGKLPVQPEEPPYPYRLKYLGTDADRAARIQRFNATGDPMSRAERAYTSYVLNEPAPLIRRDMNLVSDDEYNREMREIYRARTMLRGNYPYIQNINGNWVPAPGHEYR